MSGKAGGPSAGAPTWPLCETGLHTVWGFLLRGRVLGGGHQRTKRYGHSGLAFYDLASESHRITASRSACQRVTEPKFQRRALDPTS